jgi:hypothetical protein
MISRLFAKTNRLGITNLNLPLVPLTADARSSGSTILTVSILGLAPQTGVPSRASRLGWKSLC